MPSPIQVPDAKRRVALETREPELARDLCASFRLSFELVEGAGALTSGTGVLVVAATRLDEAETRDWVRRSRDTVSPAPTLLVTSRAPENLVHLGGMVVEGVWGIEDHPSRLHVLIRELLRKDPVEPLARSVEEAREVDPLVRRTLVAVLTASPPFRTVKRLVQVLGTSRTALHMHRNRGVRPTPLPLRQVLGLLALHRTARSVAAGTPMPEAFKSVGWSRKSLSGAAEKCLHVPLPKALGDADRIGRELRAVVDAVIRSEGG